MKNKLGNNMYFDPKMGLIGALVMASIVLFINLDYGFTSAWPAAAKQGVYTFIVAGFMLRLSENLSLKWGNKNKAYFISVLIPTLIAVGLTYLLHSLKGTPKPILSTLPTLILSPPGFFWWAYKKRNEIN